MERNQVRNDEVEIDLKELFSVLWKKAWLILLVGIALAAGAGYYTKNYITPQYQSSSMIYVLGNSSSLVSLSDLQLGSQLTSDYIVLIESRPVVEEVISNLEMNISYEEMLAKISITNQTDTRIITITATDSDPAQAKVIVDEFANVARKRMAEIMGTDEPTIVEEGHINENPVSPSTIKNCILAGMIGIFLVCAVLIVLHLMNDTIKTPDDIQKYLAIPTLGIIPIDGRRKKRKHKR